MSWINEHRGAATPVKAGYGGLLMQGSLVVLLFGAAFGGVWYWRGGPMQGTLAGDLSAKATAMTQKAMADAQASNALPAPAPSTSPSGPPQAAQDALAQARQNISRQLDAAVKPASSGARIGKRALATYLRTCGKAFGMAEMMLGAMPGDARRRIPETPQAYEARFVMLESQLRSSAIFSVGAMQDVSGKVQASGGAVHGTAANHVADFVACALARSTTAMCDANNRAAALTFLNGYFTAYAKAEAQLQTLDAAKRHALEKVLQPQRHRQIERDLAKHARSGVIMASDIGWTGHARVKEIVGEWKSVGDGCVLTKDA